MNKCFFIIFLIMNIISCKSNFDENKFSNHFKDLNFNMSSSKYLSNSTFCENYFINNDSTYSKQANYCNKPYKFQIGLWSDKNDSTRFSPINIDQFNFFLNYKLTISNKPNNNSITIIDKTGKNCNGIIVKFIGKNETYEMSLKEGKINNLDRGIDSISFPTLEKLTNKKHTLEIPNKFKNLQIILDINSQIFEKEEIVYDTLKEEFVLFSSVNKLFTDE